MNAALEDGKIAVAKYICQDLYLRLYDLYNEDVFNDDDDHSIEKTFIIDQLNFKHNFKYAIEGYKTTNNMALIKFCLIHLYDIDYDHALKEVIYNDLYEVLQYILKNHDIPFITVCQCLSNALENGNLQILYVMLKHSAMNDYAIEYFLNINKPDYSKLRNIILK